MTPPSGRRTPEVKPASAGNPQRTPLRLRIFGAAFGAFLGLALLKFGNPPIMEKWVSVPTNIYEFVLGYPWPIAWAYGLLAAVALLGASAASWPRQGPRWLLGVPLFWLFWEGIASAYSVQPGLSWPTLAHLAACLACFYLAFFTLSRLENLAAFWTGLLAALLLVVAVGWEQHFGGLAETRRYFYLYLYPKMREVSPEYLKKLQSTRIFSTLFYPNSLAGALLLLLPVALGVIGSLRRSLTPAARWFVLLVVALSSLACLYWSGSKGGWLLMLLLGLLALLRLPLGRTFKVSLVALILVGGLAGFFWKYATFFEKGATSVSARFDYWRAAVATTGTHPLLGTGPGTFAIPYARIKRPESEMARLAHNDYLEQASDSGIPGFLSYSLFIVGALLLGRPRGGDPRAPEAWTWFALWLGTLAWALQGFFEFGLYLPALAWPAFAFLGLLLGKRSRARA